MQPNINNIDPIDGVISPINGVPNPEHDLRGTSFYYMIILMTNKLNDYNDDVINNVVKPLDDLRKVIDDFNHLQDIINKIKQAQKDFDPKKQPFPPDPTPEDIQNAQNFAEAMKNLKTDIDKFHDDMWGSVPPGGKPSPEILKLIASCQSVYDMVYNEGKDPLVPIDPFSPGKYDTIGKIIDIINDPKATDEEKKAAKEQLAKNFQVWAWVNQGKFDTKDPAYKDYGSKGKHDIFDNWIEVGEVSDDCRGIRTFVSLTLSGSENDFNNQLNQDLKKYDSIVSVVQKFVTSLVEMTGYWVQKQVS